MEAEICLICFYVVEADTLFQLSAFHCASHWHIYLRHSQCHLMPRMNSRNGERCRSSVGFFVPVAKIEGETLLAPYRVISDFCYLSLRSGTRRRLLAQEPRPMHALQRADLCGSQFGCLQGWTGRRIDSNCDFSMQVKQTNQIHTCDLS